MMQPLFQHINRWRALRHVWGEVDCATTVCDWIEEQTGIDPMDHLRLTYDSAATCQKETGFLRDPLKICTECFEEIAGLRRTGAPQAGDVGIIVPAGGSRPCLAVALGRARWASLSENDGVLILDQRIIEVLAAWSVGYEWNPEHEA